MRRFAGVIVACVTLVSCAGGDCTNIGAPSTITVDLTGAVAGLGGPVRARLCVGDVCRSRWRSDAARLDWLDVDDPVIADEGPVDVSLVIESGTGEVAFEADTTVALRRMQPNGPDCDPTKYAAVLATTEAGVLVPR